MPVSQVELVDQGRGAGMCYGERHVSVILVAIFIHRQVLPGMGSVVGDVTVLVMGSVQLSYIFFEYGIIAALTVTLIVWSKSMPR